MGLGPDLSLMTTCQIKINGENRTLWPTLSALMLGTNDAETSQLNDSDVLCSVTRWLDYFFNIWPLVTMKISSIL